MGADLVKDAGEGAGGVAFEGELAVLARRALGAGPLEQHAGHAVPLAGPDCVGLHRYVGRHLERRGIVDSDTLLNNNMTQRVTRCARLTRETDCAAARRCTAIFWRQAMMREQAMSSRWAIHNTLSSASIKLLAMLTITSPSCRQREHKHTTY